MKDNFNYNKILLAHGSGGKLMHILIDELFKKEFENVILDELGDAAAIKNLDLKNKDICFSTDSYVVKPLFFPGGDIGKLSICGTINDLAVSGAIPLYISCAFIIEEGLDYEILRKVVISMAKTAKKENVKIVTGDLKVVEKGAVDKLFINTAGIGLKEKNYRLSMKSIEIGDKIIINGNIAEHGLSVLAAREELNFNASIKSDCASLAGLIARILKVSQNIKFMRDPTRGGLATTLNEIVVNQDFGIELEETRIPVPPATRSICELLGFDPLYIANEGKVVIIIKASDAKKVLKVMKRHPKGKNSRIIGEVIGKPKGKVILKTKIKGSRIVDMLVADQLPRIC